MTGWFLEGVRGLGFVLEVNILVLGFVAGGLLAAAVVVLPLALGRRSRRHATARPSSGGGRWWGMILALLALLSRPTVRWPVTPNCRYKERSR
jgi:hypothetical protein